MSFVDESLEFSHLENLLQPEDKKHSEVHKVHGIYKFLTFLQDSRQILWQSTRIEN